MRKHALVSFFIIALLIMSATGAAAAEPTGPDRSGKAAVYDPKTIYPGAYNPEVIMYRNSDATPWLRVSRPNRLRQITCKNALEHMQREGKWQGHLNPDGSCGTTAEPADWILGNRLNYEDSLE